MKSNFKKLNVTLFNSIICLVITLFASNLLAHDETQKVALEPEIFSNQAGHVTYEFQLIDLEKKTLIKDSDLIIANEKLLHFIVYDSALMEFQHLHPIYSGKNWMVEFDLKRNGSYWTWAQGNLARTKEDFSSSNKIVIEGGLEANPTPNDLELTRTGSALNSIVNLSDVKIVAKKSTMLNLKFSRTDGTIPKISPYLGAMAHVIAVTDDGDSIVHVHVMNSSNPNEGMVHATFDSAGKYRIWVQFIDAEVLKVVPLAIEVF